jgi:hypothetical protein
MLTFWHIRDSCRHNQLTVVFQPVHFSASMYLELGRHGDHTLCWLREMSLFLCRALLASEPASGGQSVSLIVALGIDFLIHQPDSLFTCPEATDWALVHFTSVPPVPHIGGALVCGHATGKLRQAAAGSFVPKELYTGRLATSGVARGPTF